MRVLMAGSHGFLGSHLRARLEQDGHTVVPLVRSAPSGEQAHVWKPGTPLDAQVLRSIDVVVNLAASPLAGNPHSSTWARNLRDSRVQGTQTLAEAVAAAPHRPAFINGGGISLYGDHGDQVLTESSDSRGDALLTSVCRDWEAAAIAAETSGARVCVLRTAPVLDRRSAPLKQQRLQFRLGLGGRIGSGEQYFPTISLRDWVGAVAFLTASDDLSGPFNLCSPQTGTNADYTRALAQALHRPAVLGVPAAVVRKAAGPMADEVLGSLNARPEALEKAGYDFLDPTITDVVASGLARR